MIKSFSHKGLEDFFYNGSKKGIQAKHANRLSLMLDYLDSADVVQDMDFPGFNLHPLKGDMAGYWAVTVSKNWRMIFQFEDGNAYIVDYVDYH